MRFSATLALLAALPVLAAPSHAQTGEPPASVATERWNFELVPYLWLANLDGTIQLGNLPEADASASFTDLLENLDFAAATFFSARKGPWVVLSDVSYTALAVEDQVAASKVNVDSTLFWTSLAAGYELDAGEHGSLDVFVGARYTLLDNDAKSTGVVNATSTKNVAWIDPIVGFDARNDFSERLSVGLLADVGGFGVGSEHTYELLPRVTYAFNRTLALHAGYRWLDTEFDDDGVDYDVTESGWILGLGIGF